MSTFNKYKYLFEPLKVGNTTFKNRIEFSPMVCDLVNYAGEATQGYIDFVESQAASGVSIIHLGATPVDLIAAPDYPSELDVTDDNKIASLVMMAEAAHRHGAKLSVELVHAGRGAHPALIQTEWALAPSNFPIEGQAKYVKEMDNKDIEEIIDHFVDCALRLKRCQFDGVLIHGAHGNLVAQFLSPLVNHRTDMWGGSFENRCRFPLKLLKAVRDAVGPNFIVELRISGDEIVDGGMRINEVVEFLKVAQEHIDLVTVSAGLIVDWEAQFYCMPPYFRPKGANIPYARTIKQCADIHIPVSVVGGIVSAEMAEAAIAEGSVDMVAMARSLLADQDLINKSYRGNEDKVRPCLRCWSCAGGDYGGHIKCAVNPALARTPRYSRPWPTEKAKKVVVIGGGVAGTQAARTLTEKGHSVILFEKSDQLGGHLKDVSMLPFKDDMKRYVDWLDRETLACGADIRLDTEATPEMVLAEAPDAIIVAVGSVPAHPPISGIDHENVYNVLDVDAGRKKPSGKVVVCGGGLSGCESAIGLAMEGCEVTVVDMIDTADFASGTHRITRSMIFYMMKTHNVKLIGQSLVRNISEKGVEVEDRNWRTTLLEADYIVDAFGMKKNPVYEQFIELTPDVYFVGDCGEVKNILNANLTAYDRCCNL
ncbi:MAG: NAD(P)/FAD-dependent oxidoreductase [Clostridiales Family XIII bacterium]|jgi:2,4-dienoyl-CoA reductase-like NADH-dependent reductase (Old Yellow Enzyme family)/thioredoxin reductase|nr:NAD(P)/FAD-dependent oxidoreductase [Clostridiales Family XIII bacterium]